MGILSRLSSIIQGVAPQKNSKNLGNYISPVQLQRIRQDIGKWRMAIVESESAYNPFRVKMQQLFQDTILNGHVYACWQKRKSLVIGKKFKIINQDGSENEEWTKWAQKSMVNTIVNYILDKQAFGYSLVNYDGVIGDELTNIKLIKRQNISPDRMNVSSFMYLITGEQFLDEENDFYDWTFYFSTPNDTAASECGYGYLYNIGIYEIFLRNLLGYNGDFVELYSQPFRVGKTLKSNEEDREEFAKSIRDMGSAGWAIIDPQDEIEFLAAQNSGTGWQGYANLEERCEKKISKVILGHADAMSSTPGKLGGKDEDVKEALKTVEAADTDVLITDFNTIVIPKLQKLGFKIPLGAKFAVSNDVELQDQQREENDANKKVADIAQVMKNAGLKMDAKYFTERTGIPAEEIEEVEKLNIESEETSTKLRNFYKSI